MGNTARLIEASVFLSKGYGGVIEGKSGKYLSASFNYEGIFDPKSGHMRNSYRHVHEMPVLKRLLSGEINLAQTPKKVYPARKYRDGIEIVGRAFSWKCLEANL